MVEAEVDDGQRLTALNELFVGDRGHQSARYELTVADRTEVQSSSGLVVGTATGASGWLASLWRQTCPDFELPSGIAADLAYFVREAWPSPTTGADLTAGRLYQPAEVRVRSRGSLVVFGDGIERDALKVEWGQEVRITRFSRRFNLVVGA